MASCSWKNIAFIFVNMQVVSRDWRWDHEKFLRLSWRVVPAKVTPARDQQSLCHWLTLRPAQRLFWDAITLLPLFFIKVAVGTIAFFFMLADRHPNCQPPHIHQMKQLKHRYCRRRPPLVTFASYDFSTLSCATKLVNMVLNWRPQKPQGLLGTGEVLERGMEVEGEGDYISIATLSPPEWLLH